MKNLFDEETLERIKHKMPETRSEKCEKCKKERTFQINDDGTEKLLLKCTCDWQPEIQKSLERQKKRKLNYFFKHSLVNPDLERASFENSDVDIKNENISREIRYAYMTGMKFVDVFDINNPRTLYIYGDVGTGKSYLSYSIAKAIKEKGYTVLFIDIVELFSSIKSTFNKNSDDEYSNIMQLINDVDLLVLDDVGANNMTNWANEVLYHITNKRQGKNNIYTTNLNKDIVRKTGDFNLTRSFSRMNKNAINLPMNGEDRRLME